MYEGQDRRGNNGGLDLLTIHNVATEAMTTIKFHMGECDKRQARIEKSQDEMRTAVASIDTKLSNATGTLHTKIETGNKEIDRKINTINYKLALIFGGLLLLREVLVKILEHPTTQQMVQAIPQVLQTIQH